MSKQTKFRIVLLNLIQFKTHQKNSKREMSTVVKHDRVLTVSRHMTSIHNTVQRNRPEWIWTHRPSLGSQRWL